MTGVVEICNIALGFLGAERITSIENPESDNEMLCALYYPIARDAVLESADWTFATFREVDSTPLEDPPAWGYTQAHAKPNEALRILQVRNNIFQNKSSQLKWNLEGSVINSDASTIFIKYIKRITDTKKYTPSFVQCLAARVAVDMCIQITENRSLFGDLWAAYSAKLNEAMNNDGLQGTHEQIHSDALVNARLTLDASTFQR